MTARRPLTLSAAVLLAAMALAAAAPAAIASAQSPQDSTEAVAIGTKADVEAQVLGALMATLARSAGARVSTTRFGGTQLAWQALVSGAIDAYPEYTGTLEHQIFSGRGLDSEAALRDALAALGLAMSRPLGFNNTWALGMKEAQAERLGIRTISDLADHARLRLGFSNEFMGRADGWTGLKRRYALPFDPAGYEHALLYGAIEADQLDVIELYSTDPQIRRLGLRVLSDDRHYFPRYDALILYRAAAAARAPDAFRAMFRLEGLLHEQTMIALNAQVDERRATPVEAARSFLAARLGVAASGSRTSVWTALWRHAAEHVSLVAVSLAAAVVVAVPLGIAAARHAALGQATLAAVGMLQTIPSLALLVFMIPLLGLGGVPTMAALFLYSLLPIVRNTHAGLRGIPDHLRESAEALGLSWWARLRLIDLPLASRTILAGIKTAAVINVGTATVGGLIGAGGFGQPIVTGLTLNDRSMILWQGAVPAALLALAVQGAFDLVERFVVPEGLRIRTRPDGA